MEPRVTIPVVQIGQKVQEIFEQKKMRLSDLADQLGTVRQNVYRIFKKRDLDTGLLTKISDVLNHNFFDYYRTGSQPEQGQELAQVRSQLEVSRKEVDYLKKIINLMEEKARLLHGLEVK